MLHIQIKIRNVRMKFFWRKKAEEYRKPAVYGDAAPAKVVQNVKLYTEKVSKTHGYLQYKYRKLKFTQKDRKTTERVQKWGYIFSSAWENQSSCCSH